jgi:methionyl-tRNA formyltransferase
MKALSAVFLMPTELGQRASDLAKQAGIDLNIIFVNDPKALESAFSTRHDLLLSFGTSIVVPHWILQIPGLLALNVHAAPPQYPGRDPHHFAVYDGAKQYGATIHHMTQSVDAGAITDVEIFNVPKNSSPFVLLELANEASWKLISRFFTAYKKQGAPTKLDNFSWEGRKSTRKMFLEMCRVDLNMSQEEFTRRLIATSMPGYNNLYIDFKGYKFRIEGSAK